MLTLLKAQFPADHFTLLALVLGLPLLGALLNGLFGKRLGKEAVTTMGLTAVGGAFLASVLGLVLVATASPGDTAGATRLTWNAYEWFSVTGRGAASDIGFDVAFSLDALSGTMALIVTGIGFLIHLYSTGYMAKDPGYHRFFCYLNLFIFSMLILILGDNMLVMFVGWEGVGLCSYLLIGFWFEDEAKAAAGKKAFITNRIGDFGLLVAMAMLVYHAGTLQWGELQSRAGGLVKTVQIWPIGRLDQSGLPDFLVGWLTPDEPVRVYVVTLIALAMFLGCAGKSAQIPLYVWLPDAMAGPTPVSALIHAATMVTAGVYLVARTSFIFVLSPAAMAVVAGVGALTALLAASIAFAQNDLKKVLAYSTVSQLGFMFIGVGVGAFAAGFFHVLTHAFFKGCLFLCAGSVIHTMHTRIHDDDRSQDMRHMGGLRRHMPITAWTFLISCLAIAGCPPLAGFWSKDELLWKAFSTRIVPTAENMWTPPPWFGQAIYAIGIVAAVGTAFYMFRAYFMTFEGKFRGWRIIRGWKDSGHHDHDDHHEPAPGEPLEGPLPHESPRSMTIPLTVLAAGAAIAGFLYAEPIHIAPLEHFLEPVFETALRGVEGRGVDSLLPVMLAVGVAAFATGAGAAVYVYYNRRGAPARTFVLRYPGLHRIVQDKWRIDELYDATVLGMIDAMGETAAQFDKWVIDGVLAKLTALCTRLFGTALRAVQTGRVQVYVASMVIGVASIGWFMLTPHAEARVDDGQMRRTGTVALEAAPGHGYGYRWYTDEGTPPIEYSDQRDFSVQLDWCQPKTVHLDVRNAFLRETSSQYRFCRHNPLIKGCCEPGVAPPPPGAAAPRGPRMQRPPQIEPGTHDAGVLRRLLVPGDGKVPPRPPRPPVRPKPSQGGRP
ncbi:MAG: NADH-quinone oxidoreductase subunit L [Deltaproteobacteria bacterium]|jgi:NADH-quinone oxidoreductase subunit L|nr:NADH-quinone oxidoreductase subunit L [Deltaproteobacteria bacterium]MBW2530485.1 NADH-quinone oxidoreductase subunit L [Deltaproteobacteria bacterium]